MDQALTGKLGHKNDIKSYPCTFPQLFCCLHRCEDIKRLANHKGLLTAMKFLQYDTI